MLFSLSSLFLPLFVRFLITFSDFASISKEYCLQKNDTYGMNKKQSKTSRKSRKISGILTYELNAPNLDDTIVNYRKQESGSNYTEIVPKRKQAIVSYDGMLMVLDLMTPHRTVLKLTGTGTGTEDITAAAVYRDSECNDGIYYSVCLHCECSRFFIIFLFCFS